MNSFEEWMADANSYVDPETLIAQKEAYIAGLRRAAEIARQPELCSAEYGCSVAVAIEAEADGIER